LPRIVEELRPYLIGWRSFFGLCQTPRVLTNLEAWIPPKTAYVSLAAAEERAQSLQGMAPQRRYEIPCCGGCRFADGAPAHVRTPSASEGDAQSRLRFSRPASHIHCALKLNPVEPPVCQVVWKGRRRQASPYPDQWH